MNILKKCNLCPRNCLVNRYQEKGYCKQSNKIRISKATLTYFEEQCISNKKAVLTFYRELLTGACRHYVCFSKSLQPSKGQNSFRQKNK